MSPLDQLRARVGEHIEDVVAAFNAAARRSGITPEDLARTDVWVVTDTSSAVVRDSVRYVDPNPPRGPGALVMFAADRAQLVNRSGVIADKPHGLKVLEAPPPSGWLMLVCISEEDGRLAEQQSFVELPTAVPSEHLASGGFS
jgi:hypothetical protein